MENGRGIIKARLCLAAQVQSNMQALWISRAATNVPGIQTKNARQITEFSREARGLVCFMFLCCQHLCDVYERVLFFSCLLLNGTNEHRSKPQLFASQLKYFICLGKTNSDWQRQQTRCASFSHTQNASQFSFFCALTLKIILLCSFILYFWMRFCHCRIQNTTSFQMYTFLIWFGFQAIVHSFFAEIFLCVLEECCVWQWLFIFLLRFAYSRPNRKILGFFHFVMVSKGRYSKSFSGTAHFIHRSIFYKIYTKTMNETNSTTNDMQNTEWVHLNMIVYLYVRI